MEYVCYVGLRVSIVGGTIINGEWELSMGEDIMHEENWSLRVHVYLRECYQWRGV